MGVFVSKVYTVATPSRIARFGPSHYPSIFVSPKAPREAVVFLFVLLATESTPFLPNKLPVTQQAVRPYLTRDHRHLRRLNRRHHCVVCISNRQVTPKWI